MSIAIGKYIHYALGTGNAKELNAMIGGRVFPVAVPPEDDGSVPYICYQSESMTEDQTKDGVVSSTCVVTMDVVARNYEQLMDLLVAVRKAMYDAWASWDDVGGDDFYIMYQEMMAGAEEWDDILEAYCRKITYTITTE